jgi:hypothetical protein
MLLRTCASLRFQRKTVEAPRQTVNRSLRDVIGKRGENIVELCLTDNHTKSQAEIVARRAELLVELFLQDLGATFVSDPRSAMGYDFIVAFPNGKGGRISVRLK